MTSSDARSFRGIYCVRDHAATAKLESGGRYTALTGNVKVSITADGMGEKPVQPVQPDQSTIVAKSQSRKVAESQPQRGPEIGCPEYLAGMN